MGRPKQILSKSQGKAVKSNQKAKDPRTVKDPVLYTVPNINGEIIDLVDQEEKKRSYTYKCCACGISTDDINDKLFPDSFSNLYAGWEYHLPICKDCLDRLFEAYTKKHHMSEEEAVRRICMSYDIYYSQSLVDIMKKGSKPNRRMSYYISKTSLTQFANKTYANTLAEEKELAEKEAANNIVADDSDEIGIKETDHKFWGFGFNAEDMEFLNNKYQEWTFSHECNTHSQEVIFKQICMLELQILKNMQSGAPTAPLQKQLRLYYSTKYRLGSRKRVQKYIPSNCWKVVKTNKLQRNIFKDISVNVAKAEKIICII